MATRRRVDIEGDGGPSPVDFLERIEQQALRAAEIIRRLRTFVARRGFRDGIARRRDHRR